MYVYKSDEHPDTDGDEYFVVGFWNPHGVWFPESYWKRRAEAIERIHYLNGGTDPCVVHAIPDRWPES